MNWWLLRRRVHSSWLIAWLCFGFIIGIFLSSFILISSLVLVVVSFIAIALAFSKRYLIFVVVIILAGLSLGLCRGSIVSLELAKADVYIGRTTVISGKVIDDVDTSTDSKFAVRLGDLKIDGKKTTGQIYLTIAQPGVRKHDYLVIKGKLNTGFGRFSAVVYNAATLQHVKINNLSRDFRDSFSWNIRNVIKDPEASLGVGFLLGEKKTLPANLVELLQLAGLTHIVVASGYNLTILVRIARRIFAGFSKYLSLVTALTMVFCFVSITGLSPSMIRAGIVSILSLLAWYYGRKFHPVVLLLLIAATTLVYDPSYLTLDASWQLSFMAFAGVMILAPLLQRYFFGKEKVGFLTQLLIETISAQLATLPILIVIFGQISNVALIANLLVLPLVPLAMLLVFLAGFFNFLIPLIGVVFGWLATVLLTYMIKVITIFAELPWSVTQINFSWIGGGLCHLALAILIFYLLGKTKYNLREVNIVE